MAEAVDHRSDDHHRLGTIGEREARSGRRALQLLPCGHNHQEHHQRRQRQQIRREASVPAYLNGLLWSSVTTACDPCSPGPPLDPPSSSSTGSTASSSSPQNRFSWRGSSSSMFPTASTTSVASSSTLTPYHHHPGSFSSSTRSLIPSRPSSSRRMQQLQRMASAASLNNHSVYMGGASSTGSSTPYTPPPPPAENAHDNPGSPSFLAWRKLHLSRAKLKAINKTSALMSGFAMVAMVELQVNDNTKIPEGLFVAFAVCTSLLVAVHMIALMISTCILPNIEAVSNLHSIMVVDESPHEKMHWYIEASWAASTVLGTFLFLCELALLCWVKFYDTSTVASWAATVVIFPVLILFIVFAIHFYHKLVVHKYELSESGIRELEQLKSRLDDSGGGAVRGPGSPSGGDASTSSVGLQRINGRMAGIEVV